ncbi:hypothetical protein KLN18_18780, partial [Clostridioides difficile]|nr:hypothetical protein [Clostridioides difficile]
ASTGYYSLAGGGSTDIRLVGGAWDNPQGLLSRIMVAGGAGGSYGTGYYSLGHGGGLDGKKGVPTNHYYFAGGGSQFEGGSAWHDSFNGSFGFSPASFNGSDGYSLGTGGGGGWYGGAGIFSTNFGGGGSSYILTKDSYKPPGYIPTSKYYFNTVTCIAGKNESTQDGFVKFTLLQALPFLTVSSYNSTQATFKAEHTIPSMLTKIEWFLDDVLKETITIDLTTEKTINYTLEDNALHTLKIVVTDSANATAEKVVSISKGIAPLPAGSTTDEVTSKWMEIKDTFKSGKTSIINTLALKNIEASLNNTLVELSEKIKTSFDSGDASLQDLMNQLTQANNTISQLSSQFKVAGGTSVAQRNDGTKIAYEYKRSTTSKFGGWLKINGLAFKPNIFVADCEYYDSKNRVDYKFLTFACHGFTTSGKQDFVVVVVYSHSSGSDKYTGDGFIYNNNEGDVWFNANGVQVPAYLPGGSESFTYTWCAVKFMNT